MSDGMLRDILELEKQIEAELAGERSRADAWLREQKRLIDLETEQKRGAATAAAERTGAHTCLSARQEGVEQLIAMRRHVRRLNRLPDAELQGILRKYLSPLFGGDGHDHPDG